MNSSASAQLATTTVATSIDNSLYSLFVIPIVLILLLIIILCNCRPINKCLFKTYRTTCCTSRRPGQRSSKAEKLFDATIIYSRLDEKWVEDNLEAKASRVIDYNINSLSFEKGFKEIDKHQLESFKQSKRIILVVSKSFISEVWVNEELQRELKLINSNDKNCSFIVIDMKDVSKTVLKRTVEELQEYSSDACCYSCEQRDKYNFSLKNVELVNGKSPKLKDDLAFLMPFRSIHRKHKGNERNQEIVNVFPKNRVAPKDDFVKQDDIIIDDSKCIISSSLFSNKEQPTYESRIKLWHDRVIEPDVNQNRFKKGSKSNSFFDSFFSHQTAERDVHVPPNANVKTSRPPVFSANISRYDTQSQSSNDNLERLKVPIVSGKSKHRNHEKRTKEKIRYVAKSVKESDYFVPVYKTNTYNNESSVHYVALPENRQSYVEKVPPRRTLKNDAIALPASVYPMGDIAYNESSVNYITLPENRQSYVEKVPPRRTLKNDAIALPESVYPRNIAYY